MASRKAGTRLELEIERCRGECQWDRIPELVKQFSGKLIASDDAVELFLGEALLEQHLKEFPLKAGSSPRASGAKLTEAKKHLTDVLNKGNLKPEMTQEAMIILGKLLYLEGSYKDALGMYVRAGLDDLTLIGTPVYKIRIIAEAYAIRGLCLEQQPLASPSRSRQSDREEEILTCYEKAGDIALLYLQEAERAITNAQNRSPKPPCMSAPEQEMGYFLEVGLQSAHVLSIRNGNLTRGVGRFREILRAVETRTTQNLRMTIARQLAEILLRGMCEQSYWNPLQDPPQTPHGTADPLQPPRAPLAKAYSPSRGPRTYAGDNLFCPQENTEEALLLLLISESMANRDGVLSRTPEHNNDRVLSLQNATVVYDLLTIALGRRGQYDMLAECLERAMKFAFEEFHLWYQFALSLAAAGKSARAVKVLKECMKLSPEEPSIPLMAAKLCMGPLHWLEEGEFFAKAVVDMEERAGEFQAKGFLALGLIYSLQATDATLRATREELQRKALTAFQRAYNLAPDDHQTSFYLALQLAISRQIPEALGYVRQALQLQGDDLNSLHLLSLLLSAQKHHQDALNILDMALSEYPESFSLLFTKVKLETLCKGPDEALLTCKHMLQIWKACYSLTNPSDSGRGSSLLDRAMADKRHLQYMHLPDFSDPETGTLPDAYSHGFLSLFSVCSVHATSVAASRVEQALSEVASSLQSSTPKQGPMHPWMILTQIWLHAAEVYVGIGKPSEALACAQEAAGLFPMSHHVLFLKGQVAELRGSLEEAKRWYDEALAISPTHVRTMQKLGLVLQRLGRGGLAEKVLRDAVRVNSTAHEAWNSLGEVLQAQGNSQGATECLLAALELEATSPAVPFTVIPRSL
ncbi:tetratricopeptide repeat protein 7B-like isoform X2 [Lethenteron reissneri]|uniref:tetratricopeptide repeat protein 7B-like isoform X2 n=1 Tax=Lethenteron reissneri TaxID=7753 RepID=UPI002AB6976A|nr:tetratricopeptide repeat protein 7B-like isoform X2 [Lethenteron reissneri]